MRLQNTQNEEKKGYLLVFAAGCLWGTIGFFVTKLGEYGAPPALIGFLRMLFAFLILSTITVTKFGIRAFLVDRRTMLLCLTLGIINQGIYNALYSISILEIGVGISAVLLNTGPIFTAIASVLVFSEKITIIKIIGLFINILGCTLAVTGGKVGLETVSVIGVLYGLGASFCYAMTPIIGRIASAKANTYVISTYSFLFGGLFLTLSLQPWNQPVQFSSQIIVMGFLYGLIATSFPYLLYYPGLKRIKETSKVPILGSMETVVATAIGILVFSEKLSIVNLIGVVLVLFSIVVIQSNKDFKLSGKTTG